MTEAQLPRKIRKIRPCADLQEKAVQAPGTKVQRSLARPGTPEGAARALGRSERYVDSAQLAAALNLALGLAQCKIFISRCGIKMGAEAFFSLLQCRPILEREIGQVRAKGWTLPLWPHLMEHYPCLLDQYNQLPWTRHEHIFCYNLFGSVGQGLGEVQVKKLQKQHLQYSMPPYTQARLCTTEKHWACQTCSHPRQCTQKVHGAARGVFFQASLTS